MDLKDSLFASKEGLTGLLCILLGVGFTCIFMEQRIGTQKSPVFRIQPSIGHLQTRSDGVRLKDHDSVIWQDLPSQHKKEVGLGDAIFTAKEASATIGMTDGTEVVIQPSSMVVFSKPKKVKGSISVERNVIQVKAGQVKVSLKKSASKPVLIEVAGKAYEIPIPVNAAKEEQALVVSIDEGKEKPMVALVGPEQATINPAPPEPVQIKEVILEEVPEDKFQKSEVITEATPAATGALEALEVIQPSIPPVTDHKSEPKMEAESAPIRFTSAEIKKIEIPLPTPIQAPKSDPIASAAEITPAEAPVRLQTDDLKRVVQKKPAEPTLKRVQTEIPGSIEKLKMGTVERNLAVESPSKPIVVSEVLPDPKPEASKTGSENQSWIQVRLGSSFLKFVGTDPSDGTEAILGSSSAVRVGFDWNTQLHEGSSVSFGMNLQRVEMMELSDYAIQGGTQNLMEVHSEYRTKLTNEFDLRVRAGQRDHLFYRAISVDTLKLDKVSILFTQVELFRDFRVSPSILATFRGGLSVHAPVHVDVYRSKMGTGFSGAFRWSQQFKSLSIFAEPFYRRDAIPLEGLDYTESELGLEFGLSFPLN